MGAKYTPGPWVVDQVVSDHDHDIILGYEIPGAGSPILVASVYSDDNESGPITIDRKQAVANARLIAAAPDLYAAVLSQQAIIDAQAAIIMAYKLGARTPEKALDAMIHFAEAEKRARAAIAKAEKETP